jgi:hypothetical protein
MYSNTTVRQYIQRRLIAHAAALALAYVAGDIAIHFLKPGSVVFVVIMVGLCITTLFVIDRLSGIECPRCAKSLAPVLVQAAVGLRNQRCPHCKLDVDELLGGRA